MIPAALNIACIVIAWLWCRFVRDNSSRSSATQLTIESVVETNTERMG